MQMPTISDKVLFRIVFFLCGALSAQTMSYGAAWLFIFRQGATVANVNDAQAASEKKITKLETDTEGKISKLNENTQAAIRAAIELSPWVKERGGVLATLTAINTTLGEVKQGLSSVNSSANRVAERISKVEGILKEQTKGG